MLFIVNFILILNQVESVPNVDTTDIVHSAGQLENELQLDGLVCPEEPLKVPFFGSKCKTDEDCVVEGELCCRQENFKICRRGIEKSNDIRSTGISHTSFEMHQLQILRPCPTRKALFEILPTQNCTQDADCGLWRICCSEDGHSYCRRAMPQLDLIFSAEIMKTFNNVMSYLQCAPPPPPLLDFFAKPCKNILDCFPNLCCQEQGRKVCRPSRRSIFPLLPTLR